MFNISSFNISSFNNSSLDVDNDVDNWYTSRVLMESKNLLEQLGECASSIINKIEKILVPTMYMKS